MKASEMILNKKEEKKLWINLFRDLKKIFTHDITIYNNIIINGPSGDEVSLSSPIVQLKEDGLWYPLLCPTYSNGDYLVAMLKGVYNQKLESLPYQIYEETEQLEFMKKTFNQLASLEVLEYKNLVNEYQLSDTFINTLFIDKEGCDLVSLTDENDSIRITSSLIVGIDIKKIYDLEYVIIPSSDPEINQFIFRYDKDPNYCLYLPYKYII